ncbi:MAG TPA: hypothetical protein VGP72_06480 [Planctomycetota bacterium]|jgi:hypothetical protein
MRKPQELQSITIHCPGDGCWCTYTTWAWFRDDYGFEHLLITDHGYDFGGYHKESGTWLSVQTLEQVAETFNKLLAKGSRLYCYTCDPEKLPGINLEAIYEVQEMQDA